jgi:anti-sigma regulatory factor (Ser/Thr protein kinase)
MITRTLTVPGTVRSVRTARQLTAELCAEAGVSRELRDSAVLLTSELVTNAITHGRSDARLRVVVHADCVRVEVTDDNSRHPVVRSQDADALDGRGLQMLEFVASAWGVRDEAYGKTVWFEVRA